MPVNRITDVMSNIIEGIADEEFPNEGDDFDYEVGLIPVLELDEEGDQSMDMNAWVVFRLACPESDSRSVMGLSVPLTYFAPTVFTDVVRNTLTEMKFTRIAAALETGSSSSE